MNKLARLSFLASALFSLFLFSGCEEEIETGDLVVEFYLTQGGEPISLNENLAVDSVDAVRIEKLKFYISHLTLIGEGELESAQIVDFETNRTSFVYRDLVAGTYSGMWFNVGLDADQNATYPPDVATGLPLSASWGMYWSWAMKYRFVFMEGRGASDGVIDGSSNDFFIALHPGADEFIQEVSSSRQVSVSSGRTSVVRYAIDIDKVLNGPAGFIDLRTENTSHTTPSDRDLALKFIQNFAAAIER